VSGAYTFSAFDVFAVEPAYKTLFDQYRILGVELLFKPMIYSAVSQVLPVDFATAVDFDNKVTPSTIAAVCSYSTAVVQSSFQYVRRAFKPRPASTYYATAITSGYGIGEYGAWMDCSYDTVPHYGLLYYLSINAGAVYNIQVDAKYTIEFMQTV